MILPVSAHSSAYNPYVSWGQSGNTLDGIGQFNLNNLGAIRGRQQQQAEQTNGLAVKTHPLPEVLQWIAKKIEQQYRIKVLNSDIPFSEEELRVLYYTLGQLPEAHLKGIKTIVKNKSIQLNMQDAPAAMFAKMHKNRVYGAYDNDNKRMYIFELDKPEQMQSVVKHEVGHAVHSNNMTFEDFFIFSLRSGWDVAYHEQRYIPGNELYNIGMTKVVLDKVKAIETVSFFDWESLKDKKDKFGKYVVVPPKGQHENYLYKNPFETFAVIYEKTR